MFVLGFIILNTHIMDQTWEKQLYCSVDSALVALRDMQIRLQFGAFALTSLTIREKRFGSNRDHSGRKNSFLAG